MASWKKVIVSGSSAELAQLAVDTNITASGNISSSGDIVAKDLTLSGDISVTALSATSITGSVISASSELIAGTIVNDSTVAGTSLTGSFSGSFKGEYLNSDGTALTAEWDGTRDGNSQITGSGAGPSLVLSGSTGTDLEVKKNAIIRGDLDVVGVFNSPITASIISASNSLIAGTTTLDSLTVSTITNDSAVAATKLTGSFTGSFKGEYLNSDGTALTAEWDGTRDGNSQITGSGAGPSLVLSGSTGDDLLVKNNAKVEGKILATDFDTIAVGNVTLFDTVGDSDLTIGAETTTVKLPGDLIELGNGAGDIVDIKGNLKVAGTASFNHSTNLSVADKYILLNSGSVSAGDGGIVIQQNTNGKGELFGYDSSANRFGITGSFNADTSADFVPDAFMSMVVSGSAGQNTPDVAPARYQQAGNIFAAANGDIYIYGT